MTLCEYGVIWFEGYKCTKKDRLFLDEKRCPCTSNCNEFIPYKPKRRV